ncbi:RagB/SusD family nutrient uptake outer membrane protein [Sphingobacterium sp. DR205]|uniref:RagB/SusD family nutrient uptake outer membrane protein n=1 Tax=Sphingobacterium sp. DR205 TaxID=2713573 RepID=UPI0013E494EA|nr:RagB/SusD family nutrient uptake outer membrane protein [Sphingobacterium sp. DR205]QIH35916.1 RagB/SusD family nutrient uptake outer membrane protein [Sphingobacterium sp. DR205]
MKKRTLIFLLYIAGFSLSSCNDYLNIQPQNQVTEENLFKTSKGYFDALVGIYSKMRQSYSPGAFFIAGNLDHMANLFYNPELSTTFPIGNADYSNSYADASLGAAFLQEYNTIASANILLEGIEKYKNNQVLGVDDANLIKGEALALRAFSHFDLLRIWGPIPGQVGTKAYLPYSKEVKTIPLTYNSYAEYTEALIADLNEAELLLSKSDPLLEFSNIQLNINSGSAGKYASFEYFWRQNRLNYYAVLALKARVYAWLGMADEATKYAKQVIAATNSDGSKKFVLGVEANINAQDRALFNEHIFGLHINDFNPQMLFGNGTSAGSTYNTTEKIEPLFTEKANDFRRKNFKDIAWSRFNPVPTSTTKKYEDLIRTTGTGKFSIPLIRLSEMYLIVAELAPVSEANTYFETFQKSRGLTNIVILNSSNRKQAVRDEYYREFYAEGQIFFMEKRLGSQTLKLAPARVMGEFEYVPPLPSGEIGRFDNVQ